MVLYKLLNAIEVGFGFLCVVYIVLIQLFNKIFYFLFVDFAV